MSLSGSLAEAHELYDLLVQINAELDAMPGKMGGGGGANPQETANSLWITMSQIFMIMRRVTAVMRQAGLPEDVTQAVQLISHTTTQLMMMYRTMILLQTAAQMGTPYGWIQGGLGIIMLMQAGSEMDRAMR